MRAITTPHLLDIIIHIITGIMDVMATVITHPLGLTTVTVAAIMAVILLMEDIMVLVMVVIEAVTAGVIMAAAFTVVIDKNGNGTGEIKRIL